MLDNEIMGLLEEVKSSPQEVDQWNILLPSLEEEEKQELRDMLFQQKQEKQILAARQAMEIATVVREWNAEHEAVA